MDILLTNDDGISSPSFSIVSNLCKKVNSKINVQIIAPKEDKSAVGQAITLNKPLKLEKLEENIFSVDGTPTDCVITAFNRPISDIVKPDVVISGINIGMNIGLDTIYSGTVAAAVQASLFGVRSFAISQYYHDKAKFFFNVDNQLFFDLFCKLVKLPIVLKSCVININLPCVPIKGIKILKNINHCNHNLVEKYNDEHVIIRMGDYFTIPQELAEGYIIINLVRCYREEDNDDIYDKLNSIIADL